MIKKTKKEALEIYRNGLDKLKNYSAVSQAQAMKLLKCKSTTLNDLVKMKILFSWKIGHNYIYSVYDKKYSNFSIRKSVLLASSDLYINYDNIDLVYNDEITKSLIQKNVFFKGCNLEYDVNYYHILDVNNITFQQLLKLFIEIYEQSLSKNVYITFIHSKKSCFDLVYFKNLFDEDIKILQINMIHHLNYNIVDVKNSLIRNISC